MHRETRFLASRALYAVDLSKLQREQIGTVRGTGTPLYGYTIPAVWFKRRHGANTANVGTLWTCSTNYHKVGPDRPETPACEFLQFTLIDGRHGGRCRTRWDGDYLWSDPSTSYTQQTQDAEFLKRMLSRYPDIPDGFDGWWRF
jgi:hypothetical protein